MVKILTCSSGIGECRYHRCKIHPAWEERQSCLLQFQSACATDCKADARHCAAGVKADSSTGVEVTGAYSQEADPTADQNLASGRSPAQPTTFAFGKIAVFPKDQPQSRSSALRLPGQLDRKLVVGHVNDPLEHEADRVADTVLRMPVHGVEVSAAPPRISRKCAVCDKDDDLQKKSASTAESYVGEAPDLVREVLRSPGHPLDAATRAYFEPRFGHDFSDVRVHDDAVAHASARAIQARAYTVGRDIVFAPNQFAPSSGDSMRLLAHELSHVVQQTAGAPCEPSGSPIAVLCRRRGTSSVSPSPTRCGNRSSQQTQNPTWKKAVASLIRCKRS